ncbi:MAG: PASTA domain-containing protein [Bacteroidetes bacterium]|nr:PASTA domain-containing protein [Bacteroidota bacterium]
MLIVYRTLKVGVVEGDEWLSMKDKWYVKKEAIEAERGNIYANSGELLKTSLQFFELRMDFQAAGLSDEVWASGVDSLALCLSRFVNPSKSVQYYKNWLQKMRNRESGNRYVKLADHVTFRQLNQIKQFPIFRRGANGGGFIVTSFGSRTNPFGGMAQRTIGYTRDNAQDVGIEGAFDEYLRGEEGHRFMLKVGANEFVPRDDLKEIEPQRGMDVVTTLDVNIQDVTHYSLLRALQKHNATWGTAIVMDVETGAIRAISNLKKTSGDRYAEAYNYAVGRKVEPGSTMKLASYMALLEDQAISSGSPVDLNKGYARFCNQDMKDSEPHNITKSDAQTAFEKSSNVGIASLVTDHFGRGKKANSFVQRLRQFRLDEKTNIKIEGEPTPYIKDAFSEEEGWSCTSLPWMSIGYEMEMTPLQIASFYNAVANDGQLMEPYIVEKILKDGKVHERFDPTVKDKAIASSETISLARKALQGVVTHGTAQGMQSKYYSFAGKTGTTQVNYSDRENMTYQSSFVGYFPADQPKYTCLVMIYDPQQNGFYGATVAGPVFRDIADRCFSSDLKLANPFEVAKSKSLRIQLPLEHKLNRSDWDFFADRYDFPFRSETEGEWYYMKGKNDSIVGLPFFKQSDRVPDVRGMALKDALFILENAGLTVELTGSTGKIQAQSLRAGTPIQGQKIKLTLG